MIMSKHQLVINNIQVPEGYKKTEFGVIPKDWKVIKMGDILKIRHGKSQHEIIDPNGIYPILATGGEIGRTNTPLYSEPSVLIGRKGTIDSPRYMDTPFWTVDTLFYSEIFNNTDAKFVFYKFNLIDWYSYNEASGVPSLNAATIEDINQAFPALKEEQCAIAQTLSDVDGLIAALDKLIAKKRNIKTATMQELLTGKKRLPEFGEGKSYKNIEVGVIPEDWEVKTYGDIFTFLTTASNPRADLSLDKEVEYIHYGDIHTKWDCILDLRLESLPSISKQKVKIATILEEGDVIVADASEDYEGIGKSVEVINISERHVVAGLHTFLLRDKNQVFTDGYRGYLHRIESVKQSIDRMATGLKVYGISKKNLKNILLPVPGKKEQRAIAQTLSDVDGLIAALDRAIAKKRNIKTATMQELLTKPRQKTPAGVW
ncbi:MAG: restriction endonuclease subunit S [Hormoscilla sp. GM102CHS1]|nr:restriction endonuclease subunit S [Hormoscilla sp. GM102CHS1]